jgi:hypothetical protein
MYKGNFKSAVRVNLSNIPGWRTKRHIVVIESDDWGSVRMSSNEAYKELLARGIPVDNGHYTINDALESNEDLEQLYDTLSQFKDSTGRYPVVTGVNVVANPDFEKVKKNGFSEYIYEPFTETCKRYPCHDRVHQLWLQGQDARLLVPIFHGREHLNSQFWLRALRSGSKSTLAALEYSVTGIPRRGIDGELVPNFQAAFDIDTVEDLSYQKDVIRTGLDLFEKLYGRRAKYFVPTNGPFNNTLEESLFKSGIKYVNTGKKQQEPLGNGQYKVNTRFLGDVNKFGQIYLTRNCFFEPSANGFEASADWDWVDSCLHEIEIAFRWHKPATISSHRVNYIGWLHPENRENSLRQLKKLLTQIIKRWPDVEFLTSEELGDLISSQK